MKKITTSLLGCLLAISAMAQNAGLEPITARVNVQGDTARSSEIIDGQWVAIGIKKPKALQKDNNLLFDEKPSYRFELGADDNSLQGYEEGSSKGRVELSYCYATSADYKGQPANIYPMEQAIKMVYDRGKGQCAQGSKYTYTFSIYVPSSLAPDTKTIFAQWHGMPSRTLVQTPQGTLMQITPEQFMKLSDSVIFNKDTGHDIVKKRNKKGEEVAKPGKENGWKIEQGGYPPLAFGFSSGAFYIKANSDSRWMTDKTDRTLAGDKDKVMQPKTSEYKISTIAYKSDFGAFPKDTWVTFTVAIDWSVYGRENNKMTQPGKLDVTMQYDNGKKKIADHIVKNETIAIGRNDDNGYYFKFGIYRTGSSTVPVAYNLAGYKQEERK